MRNQFVIIFALLIAGGIATAQNETDAFRYAQYSTTGTGRYTSLGGSMGAFGSDFSVLSANNPAGIGLYKRSEIAFTPAVQYSKVSSVYNNTSHTSTKYTVRLNNLGFVLALPFSSTSKWKTFQLATGYTNLARYDSYSLVTGDNKDADGKLTSYFDYLAANAKGIPYYDLTDENDFFTYYAWWSGLFDTVRGTNNKYVALNEPLQQKQITTTSGYLNEYVFSGGANYNDKLYIGATIGIPFFRYTQRSIYTESWNYHYDSLIYETEMQERATGVNLKLGLLYQPAKFVRFGAAFHSPTFYPKVKETYTSLLDIRTFYINDSNMYDLNTPEAINKYEYQLVTPYHVMGNIAFLFSRYGFVNVDYEYVDYATSQMQAPDYDFMTENENIKYYYQGTHTVRIGGELNLTPVAFRLGYAYSSNPYTEEIEKDGTVQTFSAGIGFKSRYFFMDFAYQYRMMKDKDVLYTTATVNPSYTQDFRKSLFALSIGWKLGK